MKADTELAESAFTENIRFRMEGLLEEVSTKHGQDKYYAAATLSTMVEVLAKWEVYVMTKSKYKNSRSE